MWTWDQLEALDTEAILLDYVYLIKHFMREVLADADVDLVVAAGVGYSGIIADWLATYTSTMANTQIGIIKGEAIGRNTLTQTPLIDG